MDKDTMKMIPLAEIYPHPDNPRKDLGDLRELTDSIRKNGIMQNLTVMPGHYFTEAEQLKLQEDYAQTHDKAILRKMHDGWTMEGYTLLIGHRRAAAALKAGIDTVPCTILRAIDKKEQIGIMLEENMQRNDLTIREQAQGFQMMLDLGDTVETVAKKTGFSKQTIKHRLAIAALDPKAIEAAESDGFYQISISDYQKLEKLPTIEDRNAVLMDVRDGRQLDYKIKFRLEQIEREKKTEMVSAKLQAIGVKKAPKGVNRWSGDWEKEIQIEFKDAGKPVGEIEKPEECVWLEDYSGICVMRKTKKAEQKKELSEYDKKQNWIKKQQKQCREIQKEMDAKRRSFILRIANRDVIPAPVDHETMILKELVDIALSGEAILAQYAVIDYYTGKERWTIKDDEMEETIRRINTMDVIPKLMIGVDRSLQIRTGTDRENLLKYDGTKNEEQAALMRRLYRIMQHEYGYVPDRDEQRIMNLTHEVFETYKEAKEAGRA